MVSSGDDGLRITETHADWVSSFEDSEFDTLEKIQDFLKRSHLQMGASGPGVLSASATSFPREHVEGSQFGQLIVHSSSPEHVHAHVSEYRLPKAKPPSGVLMQAARFGEHPGALRSFLADWPSRNLVDVRFMVTLELQRARWTETFAPVKTRTLWRGTGRQETARVTGLTMEVAGPDLWVHVGSRSEPIVTTVGGTLESEVNPELLETARSVACQTIRKFYRTPSSQ